MRLSKSSVLTYVQCPKKFKLSYIDHIPAPQAPVLQRGVQIHALIEDFFKEKQPIDKAREQIMKKPEAQQHSKAIEHVERFAREISRDGKTILVPLLAETKMFDPELNFSGVVDAVFMDGKDILVLDYKTGKSHPLDDYRFELSMYKYLVECEHNIKVTHWGIYFVDQHKLLVEEANLRETLKSVEKIREVRRHIRAGHFDKNPGWYCAGCPYNKTEHCDGQGK